MGVVFLIFTFIIYFLVWGRGDIGTDVCTSPGYCIWSFVADLAEVAGGRRTTAHKPGVFGELELRVGNPVILTKKNKNKKHQQNVKKAALSVGKGSAPPPLSLSLSLLRSNEQNETKITKTKIVAQAHDFSALPVRVRYPSHTAPASSRPRPLLGSDKKKKSLRFPPSLQQQQQQVHDAPSTPVPFALVCTIFGFCTPEKTNPFLRPLNTEQSFAHTRTPAWCRPRPKPGTQGCFLLR